MLKQHCVYCNQPIIHPERLTKVCLDCLVDVLMSKGILPEFHQGKKLNEGCNVQRIKP